MQIINRCSTRPRSSTGYEPTFELTKAIVKAKVAGAVPLPHHHLLLPARSARSDTTLHPPILRPEILAARAEPGEHLLVYQTSTSNTGAARDPAPQSGRECRIYGLRRDLNAEVVDGNLRYRPFSEDGFIDDLRTARGVDRRRRLHADGRGGLPAPADAGGAGRRAVRAGAERPLPGARGLRPGRRRAHRRRGWASSSNASPTASGRLAGIPAGRQYGFARGDRTKPHRGSGEAPRRLAQAV